jgi:hypothetical protein
MQSYNDFELIPRNLFNSSPTCMDKRPIFGQIDKNPSKIVQRIDFLSYYLSFSMILIIFAPNKAIGMYG